MSGFAQFVSSVGRFKVLKAESLVPPDILPVWLDNLGYHIERSVIPLVRCRDLLAEIIDHLQYTVSGPQPVIPVNFRKILAYLQPTLLSLGELDGASTPATQNAATLAALIEYAGQLKEPMENLGTPNAASLAQLIDTLKQSLEYVDTSIAAIIDALKAEEKRISTSASTQAQNQSQQMVTAVIASMETLSFDLVALSTNDTVCATPQYLEQINIWSRQLSILSKTIFENRDKSAREISSMVIQINSQVSFISSIVGAIYHLLPESQDVIAAIMSTISVSCALNELDAKLRQREIPDVLKALVGAFSSNKNLQPVQDASMQMLNCYRENVKNGKSTGLSKEIIALFNSLQASAKTAKSRDEKALLVLGICRFLAIQYPDNHLREETLVQIATRTADLNKNIFNEARKDVMALINVIDNNLEFLSDSALNEVNYALTTAKGVIDFVPSDPNFLKQQHTFFNAISAVYEPLSKLTSTCSDPETKTQIAELNQDLSAQATRFSSFLSEFYLVLAAVLMNRSETAVQLLAFPLSILCNYGMTTMLNQVLATVHAIQSSLQTSQQVNVMDFESLLGLSKIFEDFPAAAGQFIEVVNRNNELSLYPVFKNAVTGLQRLSQTLPNLMAGLTKIAVLPDNEATVLNLTSVAQKSQDLLQGCQGELTTPNEGLLFLLTKPFSFLLMGDAMCRRSQAIDILGPLMTSLKSSIDVIIPIIVDISLNEATSDAANLPSYIQRILTTIADLLTALHALPQPTLTYRIPEGIAELKRFDAMANALHTAQLKSFAQFMVKSLKRSQNNEVRSILAQWFEVTQSQTPEINESIAKFNAAIMPLLTSMTTDRTQFIEAFATLSVALATATTSYGKTVSPHVLALHKNLLALIQEMFESNRSTIQSQLLRISEVTAKIEALGPISKLKSKEFEDHIIKSLSSILTELHILRVKERNASITEILSAVQALSRLQALLMITPDPEMDTTELANNIISSKTSKALFDNAIQRFAKKLTNLQPDQFTQLQGVKDPDVVCDLVYDKAEIFRELFNSMIALLKGEHTIEQIDGLKNQMLLNASDSMILTIHSLLLANLSFTPLSKSLVECFADLIGAFQEFCSVLKNPVEPSQIEAVSTNLRRINRKMSKQFDSMINIVENPQRPAGEVSDFDQAKNQMYSDLSMVATQVARLMTLACRALVPEMYDAPHLEIADSLNASLSQLVTAISAIRSKAVGTSSSELGSCLSQLQALSPDFLSESEKLEFGKAFAPESMMTKATDILTIALQIAKLGPLLTDRVVIEPDPVAAQKVPEAYQVPSLPSQAPSTADALEEMQIAQRALDTELQNFKDTVDNNLASSSELLGALTKLREAAHLFALKALVMAVTTSESRSRTEQQTAVHQFANAVTAVQVAMRLRLLREANFVNEMDDALQSVHDSIDEQSRLAVEASKIVVAAASSAADDDSMDDVTRELLSTSQAIEDMSSRLSAFASQVDVSETINTNDEQLEMPELDSSENALAAFLIQNAQPILQATGSILIRARQITADLLARFGKIDNEKGIIHCAQDLSESAELLIICAEILINEKDPDAEFKVIAATRIIKGAVATLVSQVLVKGGDTEGIMNGHVRTVQRYTDNIIEKAERIANEKLEEEEARKPQKKVMNPTIIKLNLQQAISQYRKQLEEDRKNLYQFRQRRAQK